MMEDKMDADIYSEIDSDLMKIPYCSSKCGYYTICPVCNRSSTIVDKCALLCLPRAQRRRFVNLYLRGKDGLCAESTDMLFGLSKTLNLNNNPEDMIKYIDTILKVDRLYKITAVTKKVLDEKENEIPDVVHVTVTEKAKKPDPNERIVRQVNKQLADPESLYGSLVVDQLTGLFKADQFKLPIKQKRVVNVDLRGVGPIPVKIE